MDEDKTIAIVNILFERIIAINPAFKQAWPTEHEFKLTKKEWIVAFTDAKLNDIEQVKIGLAVMRMNPSPFIPSPGQFILWCRPIKPQTDTRDEDFFKSNRLESDEHKLKRRENGQKHISELLKHLRK
ncbi:Replication P [uncultured Caudovirales phage]|jgi:hypothetical protein|uniref:Replication P n=1 Tax=uncultured Caudovirales phage TaxID=2100421 RepID=A0A6J5Q1Y1_9CAUD|nr:Replication P [uncultured Caudovirales phage]CAB4167677.1 Replication P [uncultured Caudovirales phage]CAB4173594.1 Replication P [uncultured Caudovirales phage]CAB4179058.1 Replication P [uncultured Caudovirales phage]CAB4188312.1 Replication P [uncultured Caudovirales phage]